MRQSGGAETATMKLFRRPLPTLRFRGEVVPSSSIKCPEKKKKQCEGRIYLGSQFEGTVHHEGKS